MIYKKMDIRGLKLSRLRRLTFIGIEEEFRSLANNLFMRVLNPGDVVECYMGVLNNCIVLDLNNSDKCGPVAFEVYFFKRKESLFSRAKTICQVDCRGRATDNGKDFYVVSNKQMSLEAFANPGMFTELEHGLEKYDMETSQLGDDKIMIDHGIFKAEYKYG